MSALTYGSSRSTRQAVVERSNYLRCTNLSKRRDPQGGPRPRRDQGAPRLQENKERKAKENQPRTQTTTNQNGPETKEARRAQGPWLKHAISMYKGEIYEQVSLYTFSRESPLIWFRALIRHCALKGCRSRHRVCVVHLRESS